MEELANLTAIAFTLHFFWSYYRNCYRKGYTLDIWHLNLMFNLFVIHIMLPFSRSDLNVFALGGNLRRMQGHVTEAYFISTLGYVSILLGGQMWRLHLGLGIRKAASRAIELPTRGAMVLLQSRPLLLMHGTLATLVIAGVLGFYFKTAGFGFNLRGLLLVMPFFRPIAQFSAFYATFVASYCMARYYVFRERSMLAVVACISFGMLFYGERANLLTIFSLTLTALYIQLGRKIKLSWIIFGSTLLLISAFLLDALRRPSFSIVAALAGISMSVFFGNSFSDTRDFALILSYWDGRYWNGTTYLAGAFAFIPRALSTFRDRWALGVVTATMAGFSPKEHPGLRVGLFGEAYFNFGLLGVILAGIALGSTIRLIDLRMKQAVKINRMEGLMIYAFPIAMVWPSFIASSVAGSTIYSIMLILLVSWLLERLYSYLNRRFALEPN